MMRILIYAPLLLLSLLSYGFNKDLPRQAVVLPTTLGYSNLKPFYKGFYGKIGSSTLFIARKKLVPDKTRFYWAIVQVLSKKYGCFIRSKVTRGAYTSFLCRDRRIIEFHNRTLGKYILFSGRQYDHLGREIIIEDQKVVGRYPIFDNSAKEIPL